LKIVLGLGNPGPDYRSTRHNVGFWVLDRLARERRARFRAEGELKRYAWCAESERGPQHLVLAKPRTFMNRSGRAGAALLLHFDTVSANLLVVHDDADLELGRVRVRTGGGAGGHRGVRSLIEVLGTGEFPRVRLGVRGEGRESADLADYVLENFTADELPVAEALADLAAEAVENVLADGLEAAMNRFNGLRVGADSGS
jgi:PTH1 family peptidyl-tRNA hydrolase